MADLAKAFLQNFFAHTWKRTWPASMPKAERQGQIEAILGRAQEAGITVFHRETSDGVEFGFNDEKDETAFAVQMGVRYGGAGAFGHTQHFDTLEIQEIWSAIACTSLDQLGIKYRIEHRDGQVRFEFDHLADRIAFTSLMENDAMNDMANDLLRLRNLKNSIVATMRPASEL